MSTEPDFARMTHDIYERQGNMTDVAREAYEAGWVAALAAIPEPIGFCLLDEDGWFDGATFNVTQEERKNLYCDLIPRWTVDETGARVEVPNEQ